MPQSDYVFLGDEPLDVGSHGEHDFIYESGEPVVDTGRSDFAFESGTGLGGSLGVIDDFERGDLSPYQDDSTLASDGSQITITSSTVFDGAYGLSATANNEAVWSNSLENQPTRGNTFHFAVRVDQSNFSLEIGWAHTQPEHKSSGYQAGIDTEAGGYTLRFTDRSGGGRGNFGLENYLGVSQGNWVIIEVEFGDPTITVRALDPSDGSEYGSLQQDDTQSDSGYVGWDTTNSSSGGQAYADEAYLGSYTV